MVVALGGREVGVGVVGAGMGLKISSSSSTDSSSSSHGSPSSSLGLLVGLGGRVFAGQGHALVAVPQLVQLGGFVLAAAGAAVSEAGQRRAHLHALHRHRALDGLTKLEGGKKGRESEKTTLCSLLEMLHSIIHKLSLLFVSTKC